MNKITKIAMKRQQPKIGLALGCGSARGMAHIGVLKVLERHGIPVDIVSGTSAGAFIGGAYASGIDVSVLEEVALSIDWKMTATMFRPTLSRSGLARGVTIRRFLQGGLGDRVIEDLPRRFACVATDILTGEEIVMDRGPLVEAIRASISIPTVFTPVYCENRFLTDGGIVNPVPVDLARRMGADIVIGVNVIPLKASRTEREEMKRDVMAFSKIRELFRKEGTAKSFSPSSLDIMIHTVTIFEREIIKLRLERDKPDILIEPVTSNAGLKGYLKGKEAISAGERAAEKAVPKLEALIETRRARMGRTDPNLDAPVEPATAILK